MLRPSTNCLPMIFIAAIMAWRITGSPRRLTKRLSKLLGVPSIFLSSLTILPVSIRPQVDALTSTESLLLMCSSHLAPESLSSISASAVAASGIRSSASAKHIRIMPSCVSKLYCCRKASMPTIKPFLSNWRTLLTSSWARRVTRAMASSLEGTSWINSDKYCSSSTM